MKWEAVLKSIDQLVFQKTGKHLDSLQLAILKGVINSQKYSEIAENYGCTTGHATDQGYKLWQILSETLGEELHKSNFCATVERLGIANSNSTLVNPVQIGHLNLCSNSEIVELEESDIFTPESNHQNTKSDRLMIKDIQLETKLKTIPKLIKMGLTAPQISETLELSLNQVQQVINQGQQEIS
ncbi:MAG: hypothetical protein ACRCU2_04775 [Planktothrix sp.]